MNEHSTDSGIKLAFLLRPEDSCEFYEAILFPACTDVTNCDSCSNPGPLCEDCPSGYVLSQDRTKCLGEYSSLIVHTEFELMTSGS